MTTAAPVRLVAAVAACTLVVLLSGAGIQPASAQGSSVTTVTVCETYAAALASFGPRTAGAASSANAPLTVGKPDHGCSPLTNNLTGSVAVLERGGGCFFATQVLNAQKAGALAVVIYDNVVEPLGAMGSSQAEEPVIPAVLISKLSGQSVVGLIGARANLSSDGTQLRVCGRSEVESDTPAPPTATVRVPCQVLDVHGQLAATGRAVVSGAYQLMGTENGKPWYEANSGTNLAIKLYSVRLASGRNVWAFGRTLGSTVGFAANFQPVEYPEDITQAWLVYTPSVAAFTTETNLAIRGCEEIRCNKFQLGGRSQSDSNAFINGVYVAEGMLDGHAYYVKRTPAGTDDAYAFFANPYRAWVISTTLPASTSDAFSINAALRSDIFSIADQTSADWLVVSAAGLLVADPNVVITCESLTIPIFDGQDDAEEDANMTTIVSSRDLDLGALTVGLRFEDVEIPAGASINAAYLQVVAQSSAAGQLPVTVQIENATSAHQFTVQAGDITSRHLSTPLAWTLGNWTAGSTYQSPNLADLVGSVIDGPLWAAGNALSFVIKSSGASGGAMRDMHSYESNSSLSARLSIDYDVPFYADSPVFVCHFSAVTNCEFQTGSGTCAPWTPGSCVPFTPVSSVPGLESQLYYRLRQTSGIFLATVYANADCTVPPTLGSISAFDIRMDQCELMSIVANATGTGDQPVIVLPLTIQSCTTGCPAALCPCVGTAAPTAAPTSAPTSAPTPIPTALLTSTSPPQTTTTAAPNITTTTAAQLSTTQTMAGNFSTIAPTSTTAGTTTTAAPPVSTPATNGTTSLATSTTMAMTTSTAVPGVTSAPPANMTTTSSAESSTTAPDTTTTAAVNTTTASPAPGTTTTAAPGTSTTAPGTTTTAAPGTTTTAPGTTTGDTPGTTTTAAPGASTTAPVSSTTAPAPAFPLTADVFFPDMDYDALFASGAAATTTANQNTFANGLRSSLKAAGIAETQLGTITAKRGSVVGSVAVASQATASSITQAVANGVVQTQVAGTTYTASPRTSGSRSGSSSSHTGLIVGAAVAVLVVAVLLIGLVILLRNRSRQASHQAASDFQFTNPAFDTGLDTEPSPYGELGRGSGGHDMGYEQSTSGYARVAQGSPERSAAYDTIPARSPTLNPAYADIDHDSAYMEIEA